MSIEHAKAPQSVDVKPLCGVFWRVSGTATLLALCLGFFVIFAIPSFEVVFTSFGGELVVPPYWVVYYWYAFLLPVVMTLVVWGAYALASVARKPPHTTLWFLLLIIVNAATLVGMLWVLFAPLHLVSTA